MVTVLVVPADPALPTRVEQLPAGDGYLRRLEDLVGGPLVTATYDRDAYLWVNDSGGGLPVNERASRYVHEHSLAGRVRPMPDDYLLRGDVVVVGSSPTGDVDIPRRYYHLFGLSGQEDHG
jgi:hypothetical protein